MASEKKANTENKKITYTIKDVQSTARDAILSCYGISSICTSSGKAVYDEAALKAISVDKDIKDYFSVTIYVEIAPFVKISEVLMSAQKVVIYNLSRAFSKKCKKVNIYAVHISGGN
ncbi:MAG: hypothetical protein LUB56_00305 [Coprobacillus sp.]|nr:hypothetical protein [Coprobacillus sp.]